MTDEVSNEPTCLRIYKLDKLGPAAEGDQQTIGAERNAIYRAALRRGLEAPY
jgi:hypothetical protein